MISLSTAEHRSSFSQSNFAITMTWSSVETQLKNYDSSNSQVESSRDLIIYSKLSKQIFKFLKTDFIWNQRQFMFDLSAFNDSDDNDTLWNIKNIHQLKRWIKEESDQLLEVLNELQRQRDLDIEVCDLFDKISSDQIWKTHYQEINQVKQQFNKASLRIQDKNWKLESQLQVTKNVTSLISILFNSIKWSQKLLNFSLLTDEIEFIWNDWQRKIRDKLEINVDHFDNDRVILAYIHFRIAEDAVKITLIRH
jgi:hypothetical protein